MAAILENNGVFLREPPDGHFCQSGDINKFPGKIQVTTLEIC